MSPELCARITALQPANLQIAPCSVFLILIVDLHRMELCSEIYGGTLATAGHFDSLIAAVIDALLAAQNAVVVVESLGYGACSIGGIRLIAGDIISLLQLPKHTFFPFGLCIGVPDIEMCVKPRLPKNMAYVENRRPNDAIPSDDPKQYEQTMTELGEVRGTLSYHEKLARYYSSIEPKNEPPICCQGWLAPHRDEKI